MSIDLPHQILKFIKSLIIKAMWHWHTEKWDRKKKSRNRAKKIGIQYMIMKVALQSKRENGAGTARESTRTLHQDNI